MREGQCMALVFRSFSVTNIKFTRLGTNTKQDKSSSRIRSWIAHFDYLVIAVLIIGGLATLVGLIDSEFEIDEDDLGSLEGVGVWIVLIAFVIMDALLKSITAKRSKAMELFFNKRTAKVIRGGRIYEIAFEDIVVGDIVYCERGDMTPGDALFVRGLQCKLSLDEQPISISEANPFIPSGSIIHCNNCTMMIVGLGSHPTIGTSPKFATETHYQSRMHAVSFYFFIAGLILSTIVFIVLGLKHTVRVAKHEDLEFFSVTTLNVLLQAILVTLALTVGARQRLLLSILEDMYLLVSNKLAVSGIIPKSYQNLECMADVSDICINKSGIVAQYAEVEQASIASVEYTDELPTVQKLNEVVLNILSDAIAINSSAHVYYDMSNGKTEKFGSDLECALISMLLKNFSINYLAIRQDANQDKASVYDFTSARRRMSTIVRLNADCDYRIFTKGDAAVVHKLCNRQMKSDGSIEEIDNEERHKTLQFIQKLGRQGLTPICIAFNDFRCEDENEVIDNLEYLENELICVAILGVSESLNNNEASVNRCKASGIAVRMITGDCLISAKYFGDESRILSGDEYCTVASSMRDNDDSSADLFDVFSEATDMDRLEIVSKLKDAGRVVAATELVVNDAKSVQEANVGICLKGHSCHEVQNHADLVLLNNDLSSIVSGIHWGRLVINNSRKVLQVKLTAFIALIIISIIGAVASRDVVLLPTHILWVYLIVGILSLFMYASEVSDYELEPKPDVRLISKAMWVHIFSQAAYQICAALILVFAHHHIFNLPSKDDDYPTRRDKADYTIVFNTFMFCQFFSILNSRRVNKELNVFSQIWKNYILIAVLLLCISCQVLLVEFGGYIGFRTLGLSWLGWVVSISIAFGSFVLAIVVRLLVRFVLFREHQIAISDTPFQRL